MNKIRPSLLAFAAACLGATASAELPITAFTNYPQIQLVKVSPGGKYLAITRRADNLEWLSVLQFPELNETVKTNFGDQIDISSLDWVSDSRLLIQPSRWFIGYRVYKVPTGEIIGVDIDKKRSDMLFGYRAGGAATGTLLNSRKSTYAWADIVKFLPPESEAVLIQTGSYDSKTNSTSLQRMNARNGALSRLAGSPIRDGEYVIDSNNQPVFLTGENAAGDIETYKFKPEDRTWQIVSTDKEADGYIRPFSSTANPDEFLALDNRNSPTWSVILWNPATKSRQPLYRKDISDVFPEAKDPNGKVWLYRYEDHYQEYLYPDPEHPLAKVHRSLRAGFKDANISIANSTRDMSLAVAEIGAPRLPPAFYLVDVKNLKLLQKFSEYPNLKKEDLSPTDPFEVTVRDGLKIRGYLTTPNGAGQKNLPLVVIPHGGPHGIHDSYEFDPEAQLLASRGYAVMKLNYRGSGGRGRDFLYSGFGKWGREMQDDITDAVKWAIASGFADRNRICVYGGSYGAYAALTGAFREPDLFKCAVGVAGVYDLPLMFEKGDIQEKESGINYLKEALGTDTKELRARSPVYNAEKIKAKVLLIHGKDDERAPYEHAKRMREALQKAGNEPEWISEDGEAHGFGGEAHRARQWEQMLAFFAANIGPAVATPPAK